MEKRTIIQISFPSLEDAKKAKERIAAGEDIMKIAGEMKLSAAREAHARAREAEERSRTRRMGLALVELRRAGA